MTLLFLGLWAFVVIAMIRTIVRKKYQYYSASVFTKKSSFEFDEVPFDCEKSIQDLNLRQSMGTGQWEIYRRHWTHIIPWLSFLFSEKVRRYAWQLVPWDMVPGIKESIAQNKKIELTFPYCDASAQLEAKEQLKKMKQVREGGNIFSELRKSHYH